MRDFLDDFERQLAAMADDHPDLASEPAPAPARRKHRRPFALGGLSAAAAAIAATFAMTGTSLADLPILDTPTRDASQLEDRAAHAKKAGVDFSKAHVFGTPGGPGYALLNEATKTLCLVIPDPKAPGEYGGSCGHPIEKVEREGLAAELVGDLGQDPNATSLVAFVLPEGAEDVKVAPRTPRTTLKVESGVAVVETPGPARLTWTVDGRPGTRGLEGPFAPTSSFAFTCPDGSSGSVPAPSESATSPDAQREQMRALRKRACR